MPIRGDVRPDVCASCPVPALVEAVEALLLAFDDMHSLYTATDTKTAMVYEDLIRIAKEKAQAALACCQRSDNIKTTKGG